MILLQKSEENILLKEQNKDHVYGKKIEAVLIGLMIGIVGLSASTCSDKSETKGIIIQTEAGTLRLMPLNDRSIRVRFTRPDSKEMEELIYVGSKIPKYRIKESQSQAILSLIIFRQYIIRGIIH